MMTTHAINTLILVKLDRHQNLDKKIIIDGITVNYDVFLPFHFDIEMGMARCQSGIAEGLISMETKNNRTLTHLVSEHEEYSTERPSPAEL
jgi:hypothetical protein